MAKDVSAYTDTIEISATDLLTGEEIVFHIAPNSIRRVVLDGASIQLLPATDLYPGLFIEFQKSSAIP